MNSNILLLLIVAFQASGQSVKEFYNGPVKLYYEEFGNGPSIYILSGGPGQAPEHPYRQVIDSLKGSYTCVLLHQRASGKSRNIAINYNTITIHNYLRDIELLQQKRGDKRVMLLGMSWGGLLAMNYAVEHPASVAALILVCSAPPSYKLWNVLFDNQFSRHSASELDSMTRLQSQFAGRSEAQLDSLKRADPSHPAVQAYRTFIGLHIRAMYYDRRKISAGRINQEFQTFNFQPIPFIDAEVLGSKWDITTGLKKLDTPAIIIYGRQDDQGESTFFLQHESIRNSELHVIEKCGHDILDEQPEEFFRVLLPYLRKLSH